MSLMEMFSNPETMHSLSMGDKLIGGCITMLMGMGITFIVLLLLWGFVAVMGRALSVKKKDDAAQSQVSAPAPVAAAPATSDDSLVAVITAAVAAYQGAGGAGNLIIRKISRISGEITPWSNAAREDCIESRKF